MATLDSGGSLTLAGGLAITGAVTGVTNASSANTANYFVQRDANGDFAGRNVTVSAIVATTGGAIVQATNNITTTSGDFVVSTAGSGILNGSAERALAIGSGATPTVTIPFSLAVTGASTLTGNVGVGSAPLSAVANFFKLNVGANTSLFTNSGVGSVGLLMQNANYDGANYVRINTDLASRYYQALGVQTFSHAVTGIAGSTITWVDDFVISATGAATFSSTVTLLSASPTLVIKDSTAAVTGGIYGTLEFRSSDGSMPASGVAGRIDTYDDGGAYGDRSAMRFYVNNSSALYKWLEVSSAGAATFSSTLAATVGTFSANTTQIFAVAASGETSAVIGLYPSSASASNRNWTLSAYDEAVGDVCLRVSNAAGGNPVSAGTAVINWNATRMSMRQNIVFGTDNTYDIGGTASTLRPRDLFLGRNQTIGGTLDVTGATTLTGGVKSGTYSTTFTQNTWYTTGLNITSQGGATYLVYMAVNNGVDIGRTIIFSVEHGVGAAGTVLDTNIGGGMQYQWSGADLQVRSVSANGSGSSNLLVNWLRIS